MSKTTLEKGDDFELRSRQIIESMIQESQIPHLKEYIKIFNRKEKGYYSKSRESDIFFDMSIEVWPPNAERASFTYFIECKNYSTSIPVDDIEEFHSKVSQVSGLNVKAIFITNSKLQKGGYTFAKNEGLMVVQGETAEDYKIILHKINITNKEKSIPIIPSTEDTLLNDEVTRPLVQLIDFTIFESFIKIENENYVSYGIDKLSKEDIITIAEEQFLKIDPQFIEKAHGLSIKQLRQHLSDVEGIEVGLLDNQTEILGSYDVKNQKILLNPKIVNTDRELFILAHEYGHFKLHSKLIIGQLSYDTFLDPKFNFRTGKVDFSNPKNWLEWQANEFASSLVLPRVPFLVRFKLWQKKNGFGESTIKLDDQIVNRKNFSELTKHLSYIFNVTKTSVIYKLKNMELLEDNSRLKSVGEIFHEYEDELFT